MPAGFGPVGGIQVASIEDGNKERRGNNSRTPSTGRKPPCLMDQLISVGIVRAPDHHLTSAQVCQWIRNTFVVHQLYNKNWPATVKNRLCGASPFFCKWVSAVRGPQAWAIVSGAETHFLSLSGSLYSWCLVLRALGMGGRLGRGRRSLRLRVVS